MEKEPDPQEYQFKHENQIYLDEYNGVASEIMDLNDPVTDGFMQAADIRRDIVIVQKPQDRVLDYDTVGSVRVGKFLQLPRLDLWNKRGIVLTKKEDDAWYLAIDDQEIAQSVARSADGTGKFSDRYIAAFQRELGRGMKDILKKEKFLNSGEYNFSFLYSYWQFAAKDLFLFPSIEYAILTQSANSQDAVIGSTLLAGLFACSNILANSVNYVSSFDGFRRGNVYDNPFVRHSALEYLMPPIPVDRWLRGRKYLSDHGHELLVNLEQTIPPVGHSEK